MSELDHEHFIGWESAIDGPMADYATDDDAVLTVATAEDTDETGDDD